MSCTRNCKLCDKFVISSSVTFAGGNLVINLPNRSYRNKCKYCIVIAQAIPSTTTINAPVVFTIGTGTTQFPFQTRCCVGITASQISTRRIYPVRVNTDVTTSTGSGAFVYIGRNCLPKTDVVETEAIDEETTPATE